MKKIISLVLAVIMVLPLIPASAAYEPQYEYEAQMLYELGLFKGTENGFDLDKKCDRVQAAVLFIRLLGKEKEATDNPKAHPFTDVPDWASPYVGQMYHDGYTKGISATEYGTGDMTANQFATFCLRALGYSENSYGWRQFKYGEALEKMLQEYIIRQDSYDVIKSSGIFLRDYAVKLAYNSLFDSGTDEEYRFLIRILIEKGVIDEEIVKTKDLFVDDNIRYYYSPESFKPYFEKMIREAAEGNKVVSVVHRHELMYTHKIDDLRPQTLLTEELLYQTAGGGLIQDREVMADDLTTEWSKGNGFYARTTVNPHGSGGGMAYRCTRYITHGDIELTDIEKQVVDKSKEFLSTITPDMSDYDKFKAAYDFVNENVKYDDTFKAAGSIRVLVDGKAVCQGFSTAYMYLCKLIGLECWSVGGYTGKGVHAWNKVKLDGKYYNVDPTWYDAQYTYFLFKDLPERRVIEAEKIFDFPCPEDYKQ